AKVSLRAWAGSTPVRMLVHHSNALRRASASEILPTLSITLAVGLVEPGNLVTRTKDLAPLSVHRTARPGQVASQRNALPPLAGGFIASIDLGVRGFFASIVRAPCCYRRRRNDVATSYARSAAASSARWRPLSRCAPALSSICWRRDASS